MESEPSQISTRSGIKLGQNTYGKLKKPRHWVGRCVANQKIFKERMHERGDTLWWERGAERNVTNNRKKRNPFGSNPVWSGTPTKKTSSKQPERGSPSVGGNSGGTTTQTGDA